MMEGEFHLFRGDLTVYGHDGPFMGSVAGKKNLQKK